MQHKQNPAPPSLEERIASALSASDMSSEDLASLIREANTAAAEADETAEQLSQTALDPGKVIDTAATGAALAAANITRDRLRAAHPRLLKLLSEARSCEYAT